MDCILGFFRCFQVHFLRQLVVGCILDCKVTELQDILDSASSLASILGFVCCLLQYNWLYSFEDCKLVKLRYKRVIDPSYLALHILEMILLDFHSQGMHDSELEKRKSLLENQEHSHLD